MIRIFKKEKLREDLLQLCKSERIASDLTNEIIQAYAKRKVLASYNGITGMIYIFDLKNIYKFPFRLSKIGNPETNFEDFVASVINHEYLHKTFCEICEYDGHKLIDYFDYEKVEKE